MLDKAALFALSLTALLCSVNALLTFKPESGVTTECAAGSSGCLTVQTVQAHAENKLTTLRYSIVIVQII